MKDNWSISTGHKSVSLPAGAWSPQDQPGASEHLMVQCHTQNVWYTLDGSTPSATKGFVLLTTQNPIILSIGHGVTPMFLRAASGAVLQYQWIE